MGRGPVFNESANGRVVNMLCPPGVIIKFSDKNLLRDGLNIQKRK